MIPLEPSNELEGVMVQVAAGTREEAAFFERLFASELVVPQSGPPGEVSELPAEPGAEVGLPVLPAHGRRAVPAYSSEAQLRKTAPPEWSRFVRLGMPALQAMLAGTGAHLVINPGGDLSTMLDPGQIAALPERRPPAPRVLRPDELPHELLSALREFCSRHSGVGAAYAAEHEGRLAVGLVLDDGVSKAELASAAEVELGGGNMPPFGLLVIDEAAPGEVAAAMLAGAPVYSRV